MKPTHEALTRYGRRIKAFWSPEEVAAWIEAEGHRWGQARIVRLTKNGPRTVWKAPAEDQLQPQRSAA